VSSDTATFTSKDWIEHASTCMPTGNHRPCDFMNTPAGALNHSQWNQVGSGATDSACVHPTGDSTFTNEGIAT